MVAGAANWHTGKQTHMLRSNRNYLGLFRHATQGAAAIEFAITASLLLIPFLGVAEVGFAAYQAMQVQSAVDAGALYASQKGFDPTNIGLAVQNASSATGVKASPAPSEFYGCPSSTGIAVVSTSTCADGTSPGTYVQVNATLTRTSLIANSGLTLPATLTAKSIVRVN